MSGNIKTLNSSKADSNPLFDTWHERHHKVSCHHGGLQRFKNAKRTFLLLGTPNVGKSTFFNKITTATATVSNIDRLTVEDTVGRYRGDKETLLVDLPGIYNLSHPIDEEKVVAHEIFSEDFDKIVNIIGAQSIQRDLMLTLQCIETGLLNTVVINMIDEVQKNAINTKFLSKYLNGANIVLTQANRNIGIDKARQSSAKSKLIDPHVITYSDRIETYIRKLSNVLPTRKVSNRFYALMLLEGNQYVIERLERHYPNEYKKIKQILGGVCLYDEIVETKKQYINKIIQKATTIKQEKYVRVAKHRYYKADRILLNKLVGIPAFILLMVAIYFISFSPWTGGGLQSLLADDLFNNLIIGNIHHLYANAAPGAQWVACMFVDGVLNGFFAVLSFIPVIVILFILVNIINQVGILSRVSVLLDQTFEKFGISGRSVINLLTGFGCNVPAIMLSRSSNSIKERVISILIAPFIACSARVIVISFVSNLLFGVTWGWVAMILFTISSGLVALFMGLFFSKTMFRKSKSFFLIEMVDWRKPDFMVITKSVWLQLKEFIKKAGITIVLASLIIWLLLHICPTEAFNVWYKDDNIDSSLLGYTAKGLEYIFVPIGFGNIGSGQLGTDDSWKLTASLLSALPAKEIAIANIQMLNFADNFWLTHVAEGLSYMVMIMLMTPCVATMAVLKREGGWKNLGISLGSSFAVAYLTAAIIYWISFAIVR